MKKVMKPFVACLSLLGLVSLPTFAMDNAEKLDALQKQMNQLQFEMNKIKADMAPGSTHTLTRKHAHARLKAREMHATKNPISGPKNLPVTGTRYLPMDLDAPGESFVSTGPYLGVPIQYSGSNLIINNPNINEDVALLNLRKNINKRLCELGVPHPEDHAHLLLSGLIEGQANYKSGGTGANTSDINLTSVNLDSYILGPSSWTSGLISLSYEDDIGSNTGVITSMHRVSNSRVFVNKAFIILGDFLKSPLYATLGQMYVPFGTYSTSMVTSPMTKVLARTKARALLVGYQQQCPNTLYAAAYAFKGDAVVPGYSKKINNGGLNFGYRFKEDPYNSDIGVGVIANIADSVGLQRTDNRPAFDGFGSTSTICGSGDSPCGSEQLKHRVPAYDVHAMLGIGEHWDWIGEYIRSGTRFNPNDLSYNNHGAKPQALNTELSYSFQICDRPNSVAVGYGMTKDALVLGLPAKRYSLAYNTSFWRDTLQSLEFRHDIDYPSTATSSGSNIPGPPPSGKSDNVLTAQFDIYF